MEVQSLPKATFSRTMFLEARRLSQLQVIEEVIESDQLNTLQLMEPQSSGNIMKRMMSVSLQVKS